MKNLKLLFNTVIAAGAVILFGTAGFSDNTAVELGDVAGRAVIGLCMIIVGLWGRYAINQAYKYISKMRKRYQSNLTAAIKMMKA